MATGDGNRTAGALHRLRQRWLSPSPPLAVDDLPPTDPEGEQSEREADSEGSGASHAGR